MPPAEPIRYLETGVNNFGNAYLAFDFGGPVATAPENGKLFYRVVGQVQGGGTQVDFTPDNNFFIAPSVTWKPDADTTLTVLASASKYETRSLNFLPHVGTVTSAPFGWIPTSLFASDPSVDTFKREQEMLGYHLERHLSDNVTFRQNARVASGAATTTGGNDCAPDCGGEALDCANGACGHNNNTDAVADAAIRNKSRGFKTPPQPASTCCAFRKFSNATRGRIREGRRFL